MAASRKAENAARNLDLRAIAIVPARLASQRLERKMLLSETGKPLFVHTIENVRACPAFARVIVATDSDEIARSAQAHGIEAASTRREHPSGTDRVFEAFTQLRARGESANVVVNVQGDEPDLAQGDLARLVAAFMDPKVMLATLAFPIEDEAQLASPSVVKVVCDARGDALYFSRAPIPFRGHATEPRSDRPGGSEVSALAHIGVYAFTPEALERFCALPRGKLEVHESLEQLRWLEAGQKLRVLIASSAPNGIDTRSDYDQFIARVRARARASERADVRPNAGTGGAQPGTNLEKARAG